MVVCGEKGLESEEKPCPTSVSRAVIAVVCPVPALHILGSFYSMLVLQIPGHYPYARYECCTAVVTAVTGTKPPVQTHTGV